MNLLDEQVGYEENYYYLLFIIFFTTEPTKLNICTHPSARFQRKIVNWAGTKFIDW